MRKLKARTTFKSKILNRVVRKGEVFEVSDDQAVTMLTAKLPTGSLYVEAVADEKEAKAEKVTKEDKKNA